MAFADVMHRLGRIIGLYGEDDEAEYEDEYDMGQDYPQDDAAQDEYDDGEYGYDEQQYDDYEDPAPQQRAQTSYQSAYSTGGSYVRAGAKPKAAPARSSRPVQEPAPMQGFFSNRSRQEQPESGKKKQTGKVVPINGQEESRQSASSGAPSTIIFCVRRKDDSSQIIEYLISGVHVILNFEEVDDVQCQRVLDMVSGAAFALRGSVERISHRNYLVAPSGVEIVRSEAQAIHREGSGYYAAR